MVATSVGASAEKSLVGLVAAGRLVGFAAQPFPLPAHRALQPWIGSVRVFWVDAHLSGAALSSGIVLDAMHFGQDAIEGCGLGRR